MSGNTKVQARKLKGFQDYHPRIQKNRLHMMDLIRKHARTAGFQTIATPALEYSEVLLGVGGETDKQVFRFEDNGKRDVSLRFDLTVPFARYVAEHHGQLIFPFKRLQMGDVWRAEKPQKGRFREFTQCDLDIVGVNSNEADIEILLCLHNILNDIDCGPFTMHVGHRQILTAMIRKTLGNASEGCEDQILIILDKLDKVGPERVVELLMELPGVEEAGARRLTSILAEKTAAGTDLDRVRELLSDDKEALEHLESLTGIARLAADLTKEGKGRFRTDLSIARGLGYYTGLVFETTLDDLPGWGSVCSGGRYNHLVERYLSRELPGIGGSIGLDRLLAGMVEMGRLYPDDHLQTVFIAVGSEAVRDYAFTLAARLRAAGISTDIALKLGKLGTQFKHADRLGYPLVITLGVDEMAAGSFSVKQMATGKEEKGLPIGDCVSYLKGRLNEEQAT